MAIQYSDGVTVEARILDLLRKEQDLGSGRALGLEHWGEWPVRYHLCPERANLVRHLEWDALDVLELGAGMGGVSRYLAEKARSLTVVEGTEARFSALSERLRDLKNWTGTVANIQSVELSAKFDVVCVIGVLEYSELYIGGQSPFVSFLQKAESFLKPDGVLLLAIENKLGLKYWSGAAEDHSARMFDGICGYPAGKSPKTFSRSELRGLLERAGFTQIDEHFPFPDYKIPSTVITREFVDRWAETAGDMAATHSFENYGMPRVCYFPDSLAIRNVAKAGLLAELANSFLFFAVRHPASETRRRLLSRQLRGEKAWHYGHQRLTPVRSVFRGDESPRVSKEVLGPEPTDRAMHWSRVEESLQTGELLRFRLGRFAYFEEWDAFRNELRHFLEWAFAEFTDGENLRAGAVDATVANAILSSNGSYRLFDLEWRLDGPVPKNWFVFRNVYALARDAVFFPGSAPFSSLRALYEEQCGALGIAPDFTGDAAREARLQAAVGTLPRWADCERILTDLMERALPYDRFPRDPRLESGAKEAIRRLEKALAQAESRREKLQGEVHQLIGETTRLTTEVHRLHLTLQTLPHRVAHHLKSLADRFPYLGRILGRTGGALYSALKRLRHPFPERENV